MGIDLPSIKICVILHVFVVVDFQKILRIKCFFADYFIFILLFAKLILRGHTPGIYGYMVTPPCLAMEISILASMLEAFFSSLVGSVTTTVFPLLDELLLAGVVGGGEETLVAGGAVAEALELTDDGDGVVADDTLEDTLAAAAAMETDKTEEEATVKGELLVEERLADAGGLAEVDSFTGGELVEELAGGPVVMFGGGPAGRLAGGPAGGPADGLAGGLPGGLAGGLPGEFTGGLAGGLAGGPVCG